MPNAYDTESEIVNVLPVFATPCSPDRMVNGRSNVYVLGASIPLVWFPRQLAR